MDVFAITDPRSLNLELVQKDKSMLDFGNCSAIHLSDVPELKYCSNTDLWIQMNSQLSDPSSAKWVGMIYKFLSVLQNYIYGESSSPGKDFCNWKIGNISCGYFYQTCSFDCKRSLGYL